MAVFEVLSSGTSRTDRIDKVREYQATESIQRYVILEQDSIGATVFEREGGFWRGFTVKRGELLRMPEIGVELPLAECYAGVDMSAETGGDAP